MSLDLSEQLNEYNEIIEFLCDIVKGVVDTNYVNTLLISGTAGIGKSWNIDRLLTLREQQEKNPIRYIKYTGHVTPRALYEKLKENAASDCVLVFDDADSVITNEDSVNIIKAASERTRRRHINWISSLNSDNGFDFEGKIIVITNIVLSQSPHLAAIKDRFHLFNMEVTYLQKLAKIQEIANATSDPRELEVNRQVVEFLMENRDKLTADTISIRTFKKLSEVAMLMPERWKRFVELSNTYLERPRALEPGAKPQKRKYTRKQGV